MPAGTFYRTKSKHETYSFVYTLVHYSHNTTIHRWDGYNLDLGKKNQKTKKLSLLCHYTQYTLHTTHILYGNYDIITIIIIVGT